MHSHARYALPGLLLGAVLIGLAPILVRLSHTGPTAAAFWRVLLALPVLALLRGLAAPTVPTAPRRLGGLWLAGFAFAGDLAFWHQSIRLTSVANATLLSNLAPVFLALTLQFAFGQRQAGRFWLGLALAIFGAGLLLARSLQLGGGNALGDVCGIGSAVFYGAYQLIVSRARRAWSTLDVMLASSAACAAALLPLTLAAGESLWPADPSGWWALIGLALVAHVGGQGLIAYALASLPTAFASVTLLVQPVAAAVFAWVILGEAFGAWQAVGGVVVMAGIVLCRLATPAAVSPAPARPE
jgi:drug/metabolite transporter (DMT)-like permease